MNQILSWPQGFYVRGSTTARCLFKHPSILREVSAQMPAEQVVLTQKIACLRIHVERATNKINNFHIWDGVLPLNLFGLANQIWSVCAFLCNAQPIIISA